MANQCVFITSRAIQLVVSGVSLAGDVTHSQLMRYTALDGTTGIMSPLTVFMVGTYCPSSISSMKTKVEVVKEFLKDGKAHASSYYGVQSRYTIPKAAISNLPSIVSYSTTGNNNKVVNTFFYENDLSQSDKITAGSEPDEELYKYASENFAYGIDSLQISTKNSDFDAGSYSSSGSAMIYTDMRFGVPGGFIAGLGCMNNNAYGVYWPHDARGNYIPAVAPIVIYSATRPFSWYVTNLFANTMVTIPYFESCLLERSGDAGAADPYTIALVPSGKDPGSMSTTSVTDELTTGNYILAYPRFVVPYGDSGTDEPQYKGKYDLDTLDYEKRCRNATRYFSSAVSADNYIGSSLSYTFSNSADTHRHLSAFNASGITATKDSLKEEASIVYTRFMRNTSQKISDAGYGPYMTAFVDAAMAETYMDGWDTASSDSNLYPLRAQQASLIQALFERAVLAIWADIDISAYFNHLAPSVVEDYGYLSAYLLANPDVSTEGNTVIVDAHLDSPDKRHSTMRPLTALGSLLGKPVAVSFSSNCYSLGKGAFSASTSNHYVTLTRGDQEYYQCLSPTATGDGVDGYIFGGVECINTGVPTCFSGLRSDTSHTTARAAFYPWRPIGYKQLPVRGYPRAQISLVKNNQPSLRMMQLLPDDITIYDRAGYIATSDDVSYISFVSVTKAPDLSGYKLDK